MPKIKKQIVEDNSEQVKSERIFYGSVRSFKDLKGQTIYLDRKSEDKDVDLYQKTQDPKILERLYVHRIPTIHAWVKKNYYPGLCLSEEDFFSELSIAFLRAIKYFKIKRGSFNTLLFTLLENRIKNIKSSLHAKKRTSKDYEGPLNGILLSLNHTYGDAGDGVQLQDCIAVPDNSSLGLNDIINVLSEGDNSVKDFLLKLSNGETITTVLNDSKIESINVSKKSFQLYKNEKISKVLLKRALNEKLSNANSLDKEFTIIEWQDKPEEIEVLVKRKKTEKYLNLVKALNSIKTKKEEILQKIM